MDEGGNWRGKAQAWLREPLVHFMLAGLLVFFFSMWRGESVDPASRTINITAEQVARLSASWEKMWRRPPSPGDIDALIRDYIKEEVYYREARRLGLDEDDAVIRRRLRSKMEFLASAQVESVRPDDRVLEDWLEKHPARFAADAVYSFDQIFLGSVNASLVLKAVSSGADWTNQGEQISLPKSLESASQSEVERQFGADFVRSLATASRGKWVGPIASGFGPHLVRLRQVETKARPWLAEVRQAVENDWRAETYQTREAKAYQALLDGYTIRIEKP
jgi:peptidyl-prolyl cis-trans isomerase C